jgi:hypothetical protein
MLFFLFTSDHFQSDFTASFAGTVHVRLELEVAIRATVPITATVTVVALLPLHSSASQSFKEEEPP